VSSGSFTVHQHCGAATYFFFEKGHFIPITNCFDVEGFLEFMEEITPEINGKISKVRALSEVMGQVPEYIDEKKVEIL
jgi:7,8-dihydro-6-hydroxymethylpterin dimethyltransferase